MTVAKEHLCFAACVEVAAKQLGAHLDQVGIANQLGVTVPSEFDASALISHGVDGVAIDPEPRKWGIEPDAEKLDNFFARERIPLSVVFHPISQFQDWGFEAQIVELTRQGQLPIVGFDYRALFKDPVRGEQGHCCVIFECSDAVRLYDPGPYRAGFKTVDMFDLYRACRKKPGGLWVLHPKNRPPD